MKILKSCFKVIQRTFRSWKNLLKFLYFSAILRVKLRNLQAWPNSAHQDPSTHNGKTRQCVKIKLKLRSQKLTCRGCASQKWSNHIYRKSFDFFVLYHAGKITSLSPVYPSNRLFQKPSGSYFARFLVPEFPVPPWTQTRTHIEALKQLNHKM